MIFWIRNKLKQKRLKKAIGKGNKVMFGGGVLIAQYQRIFSFLIMYI